MKIYIMERLLNWRYKETSSVHHAKEWVEKRWECMHGYHTTVMLVFLHYCWWLHFISLCVWYLSSTFYVGREVISWASSPPPCLVSYFAYIYIYRICNCIQTLHWSLLHLGVCEDVYCLQWKWSAGCQSVYTAWRCRNLDFPSCRSKYIELVRV